MPDNTAHPPSRSALRWGLGALVVLAGAALLLFRTQVPKEADDFARVMNTGKNYLDQGEAEKAVANFTQAVALGATRPDAHLNLANACLLAGQSENALKHARETLGYDRNSAAAYYVAGCANLRLRHFEEALQDLQQSHDLDPAVAAVSFQLGRAHQELGHWEEAVTAFTDTIKLAPEHAVAHYALSQALIRLGRQDEAMKAIEAHRTIQAKSPGGLANPATFERCKHTLARAPQVLEKPDKVGVPVLFVDATSTAFDASAGRYHAPIAVLDFNHNDRNSLFVAEGTNGFRLLSGTNGVFTPLGPVLPGNPAGRYARCLSGDLNNDRFEDVLVTGEPASHIFRFATNGAVREVTAAAGLKNVPAVAGGLVDMDFTGKLDFLAASPGGNGLRLFRNLGNLYFKDITATSGIPASLAGVRDLAIDDWNNDDLMDVIVSREGQPPLLLLKQRGGTLVPTNLPSGPLSGAVIALGDVNNDSRADLLLAAPDHVDLLLGGINQFTRTPASLPAVSQLLLLDYDNDGWLDLLAVGHGIQLWRNVGDGKFENTTGKTALEPFAGMDVDGVVAADFDQDGDTDLVLSVLGQGLKLLRNDGGNVNHQLKIRLSGNRSNASGLGIRVEAAMAGFRVNRTVSVLPVEIGLGKRTQVDSLTARWFDLAYNIADVKPDPRAALVISEPVLPTGSCPYLYAWDGTGFRFVTDILGASPVGLRVTDSVFIDAEPHEHVWIGGESGFPPRDGQYVIQITEELREVLYLDEAKLVVVDHPIGTEAQPTDKLRPRKPFPRGEIWTLGARRPLAKASRVDGVDVTELLAENDGKVVSPVTLRIPQLRGLAEPHGVILDFGALPIDRPLVLALTGWLRFGGGMANVASSHDPDLPFPFPTLDVETSPGVWRPIPADVGAPCGKTKTILVDLAGKLPSGASRLRLSTAFEIHWDRAALFERFSESGTRITRIPPGQSDLHWRGFSEFADLPWTSPLTPVYDQVYHQPHWTITPTGWCSRYGPLDELISDEDNAVAILNGGDELTLKFPADQLPPKAPGTVRDFFLYSVGWDKDSDFHVELGWKVDPLPWHGMDDQRYGQDPRPGFPSDARMRKYNTRWVGQYTLKRASR